MVEMLTLSINNIKITNKYCFRNSTGNCINGLYYFRQVGN